MERQSQLLNKAELAARLGITRKTLDKWLPNLPFQPVGGFGPRAMFLRADVDRYLSGEARVAYQA
jgi:hypothetical protein